MKPSASLFYTDVDTPCRRWRCCRYCCKRRSKRGQATYQRLSAASTPVRAHAYARTGGVVTLTDTCTGQKRSAEGKRTDHAATEPIQPQQGDPIRETVGTRARGVTFTPTVVGVTSRIRASSARVCTRARRDSQARKKFGEGQKIIPANGFNLVSYQCQSVVRADTQADGNGERRGSVTSRL